MRLLFYCIFIAKLFPARWSSSKSARRIAGIPGFDSLVELNQKTWKSWKTEILQKLFLILIIKHLSWNYLVTIT